MSPLLPGHRFILLFCLAFLSTQIASAQEISNLQTSKELSKTHMVQFGNKTGGLISKKELLTSAQLGLTATNDTLFQVVSFRLTRVREGETNVEMDNRSNGELTEEMKELLGNSLVGDKIYFEYIKLGHKDGTRRSIGSLSFVVE